MIVSASRRTDIPAYYSDWFMGRVAAGYCLVRNPFDANRHSRVSLDPGDVDFLVLWTRDPRPLAPRMRELDSRGFRSYVQMTITGYPPSLEPGAPPLDEAINALCELSDTIGPERVLWRYDPVFVARGMEADFHLGNFERIAAALEGRTRRVTVSLLDEYAHTASRLARAGLPGTLFGSPRGTKQTVSALCDDVAQPLLFDNVQTALPPEPYPGLLANLAAAARAHGMETRSCAEGYDLGKYGIEAGACVDSGLAASLWGIAPAVRKDGGQRSACLCAPSVDIGAYGSCPRGCVYCYANRSQGRRLARGPADEEL